MQVRVTPDQLVGSVDASLKRLGTDYIDLLQVWTCVGMGGWVGGAVAQGRGEGVGRGGGWRQGLRGGGSRWGMWGVGATPPGVCSSLVTLGVLLMLRGVAVSRLVVSGGHLTPHSRCLEYLERHGPVAASLAGCHHRHITLG